MNIAFNYRIDNLKMYMYISSSIPHCYFFLVVYGSGIDHYIKTDQINRISFMNTLMRSNFLTFEKKNH